MYSILQSRAKKYVLDSILEKDACIRVVNMKPYMVWGDDPDTWFALDSMIDQRQMKYAAKELMIKVFKIYGTPIWSSYGRYYYKGSLGDRRLLTFRIIKKWYDVDFQYYINEFRLHEEKEDKKYDELLWLLVDPLNFMQVNAFRIYSSDAKNFFDTLMLNIMRIVDTSIVTYWLVECLFETGVFVQDVKGIILATYIELLVKIED